MADSPPQVSDPAAFQPRSLAKQVILSVVTLSLYCIYWVHVTHKQLAAGTDAEFNPTLRTVGLFVPIYNLVVMWKTSQDCEAVTDQDGVVLFLLWLVFVPAFWYLVQSGINDVAERG
ncbi:DUF4234 domain-containing protein [Haloplanus halobius]|uniref:DUF4234 domain-containing protein n=1 Tax=Haloplanus halobius TaxID=2934938 RepID=UPI00200F54B1|nr:DUF4234 domain-containing protein [Haloplanus sp. XH21]